MKPTQQNFNYDEWKQTVEAIETSGMSVDLFNDLILHFMLFFSGYDCLSEYSEQVRDRSLHLIPIYANKYKLTKDVESSLEVVRIFTLVTDAPNSLFLTLENDTEFEDFILFKRKLDEIKIALDRHYDDLIKEQSLTNKDKSKFPTPPDATWEDVRIKFLNRFKISISIGGIYRQYAPHQMGMSKNGDEPTVLWELLLELYENPKGVPVDEKITKRMQRLRTNLQSFFGIDDDPFIKSGGILKTKFRFKVYTTGCKDIEFTDIEKLILKKYRQGEEIRTAHNSYTPIDDE